MFRDIRRAIRHITPRLMVWVQLLFVALSTACGPVVDRLWGQTMPSHCYFAALINTTVFTVSFGVRAALQRRSKPRYEQDSWWPCVKQSVVIGFIAAVAMLGDTASLPHVPGPARVLAHRSAFVVSVYVWRFGFGSSRFGIVDAGALIATMGMIVQAAEAATTNSDFSVKWYLLHLLCQVPVALWPVTLYRFTQFKGSDGEPCLFSERIMWMNAALVVWLIAFFPIFSALGQPPFGEFRSNFAAAWRCTTTGTGGLSDDNCGYAPWLLLAGSIWPCVRDVVEGFLWPAWSGPRWVSRVTTELCPFLSNIAFWDPSFLGSYHSANRVTPINGCSTALGVVGVALISSKDCDAFQAHSDIQAGAVMAFFTRPWPRSISEVTEDSTLIA